MMLDRLRGRAQRGGLCGAWSGFAVLAVGILCMAAPNIAFAQRAGERAAVDDGLRAAMAIESAMVEAIARSERSVVSIALVSQERADGFTARDREPAIAFGAIGEPISPTSPDFVPTEFATGVIVDRSGLVLTNYHALKLDADTPYDYWVTTVDRKVYRAKAKARGADPRSDLAILELIEPIGGGSAFQPIAFGDASKLRKGQIVIALGNPHAIARDGQASASWGIISNLGRKALAVSDDTWLGGSRKDTIHHLGALIQTDAKLNLGTSGGALLNLRGEMVGLTTAMAALSGYEQSAGYAIPVDDLFRRAVESLKRGEEVEYGLLGVQPTNLEASEIHAGAKGSRILHVESGTPARRAGLMAGDIIEAVEGAPVHDKDSLMLAVSRRPPASKVRLMVRRDGEAIEREAQLAKLHVEGTKVITSPKPAWRGASIDFTSVLMARMRAAATYDSIYAGVAVIDVAENSPTWAAGLRAQMVITHVEGEPVESPDHFRELVAKQEGNIEVRLSTGQKLIVPAQ